MTKAVFAVLGADVLGTPWDKLVVLAIVTSAIASTQTTIIPASRTSSPWPDRARCRRSLARIHPRFRTPHISTAVIALLAIAWYVAGQLHLRELPLRHDLRAVADDRVLLRAHGLACAVYYRRELTKSVKNLLFIGVAPLVGAACSSTSSSRPSIDFADVENSYTGQSWLGVGPPLVIGLGFLLLGFVLAGLWRLFGHTSFFRRQGLRARRSGRRSGSCVPDPEEA